MPPSRWVRDRKRALHQFSVFVLPGVGVYDYVKWPPGWDMLRYEASVVTGRSNTSSRNTTLIGVVIVVGILYFARVVLIPLALAVLVAFLLGPLVMWLRHRGIRRLPSVLIVVHLAFAVIAALGFLLAIQLTELGHKMPEYEQNIHNKLKSIRDSSSGVIGRFSRYMHDFNQEMSTPATRQAQGDQKPVPVEIQHGPFSSLELAPKILGSLAGLVLTAIIVIVFVIFILLQQEDLRDRVIRLAGSGRLNVTTKALDETGERVSRYLLAQLIVNVAFGIPAGVALYFLGVPNPILWGMLAALFRYIPYLGIWIAAVMPAAVLFAIDPSWVKPFLVFGIYFGIDLLMYNFVEPWVYGNSTGMTPLAILVAAVFWTWLWGAVGLLLATPLTVCLAVLGRHVPSLRFLGVLLSDEPVLSPEKRFYQRLLATDVEEASGIADEFLKQNNTLEKMYDTVIIPALSLAEEDRRAGRLDEEQGQAVFHDARLIVEDMCPRSQGFESNGSEDREEGRDTARASRELNKTPVLVLPARSEVDEVAGLMLAQLLEARGVRTRAMSASALASEQLEEVARDKIRLVCILTVRPDGHLHVRYLCKRLREQFPDLKIVTAILLGGEGTEIRQRELLPSADEVATTLAEAVAGLCALLPVSSSSEHKAFSS